MQHVEPRFCYVSTILLPSESLSLLKFQKNTRESHRRFVLKWRAAAATAAAGYKATHGCTPLLGCMIGNFTMTQATHRVALHVGMMGARNLRARGVDAFFSGGGGGAGAGKKRRGGGEKGGRGANGSSL
jgi:hypothetical protein